MTSEIFDYVGVAFGVGLVKIVRRAIWKIRLQRIAQVSAITLLGLGLRIFLLGNARLWYDESGSVWMAQLPWEKMIAATAGDVHPPLYLAILWAWVRMAGTSEAAARLPSVIFSMLCIPLTYLIARRLKLSNSTALVAAGLMAVLPSQLNYAQEARMYSLLTLEFGLALYAALSRRWWLFGLSLCLGYWTHNYGLLYAVTANLVALWQIKTDLGKEDRSVILEELAYWFTCNVFAVVAWLPWLPSLLGQMHLVRGRFWIQIVTPGTVLYTVYMMVWAFAAGDTLQSSAAFLMFGALAFSTWRAIHARSRAALLCLMAVVVSLAVPVIISVVWNPILLPRGLMPATVPLCMFLAWALFDGLSNQRRLIVALLALPTLLAASALYYVNVVDQKSESLVLSRIDFKPGDIVYHVNDASQMVAHLYLPASWPQYELPSTWDDVGDMSDATKAAFGFQIAPLQSLTFHRAWVVYAASAMTAEAEDQTVKALLAQYVYEVIYDHQTNVTHEAIYLVWNYRLGRGVP